MAHYRKIDPRMWNDEKFRSLSIEGKLAFVLLLTHPHMTALGAMRATIPGLASELGDAKGLPEAFREVFAKGLAKHDERAACVYLPKFLKYNKPESPNVIKAWIHAVDLIPECGLKYELIQEVKGYAEGLPEAFGKALPEVFAKAMPYQEQEQEPNPEEEKPPLYSPLAGGTTQKVRRVREKSVAHTLPPDFKPTADHENLAWSLDLHINPEFTKFCDFHQSKGSKFVDWNKALNTWIRNAPKFIRK